MSVFFILLLALAGCGSENPSVPRQAAGQASALADRIALRGSIRGANGVAAATDEVSFKITSNGLNQFALPDGSCRTDPRMQGGLTTLARTDSAGRYAIETALDKIVSVADVQCGVQLKLGQLESLVVDASVEADQAHCTAYCSGSSPGDVPSCVSSCLSGNRRITGSRALSRGELVALDAISSDGLATTDLDLTLSALGPPLSAANGPDLTVDGGIVETSARVVTESFAADDCAVLEGCLAGTGERRLLRFDGSIQNLGDSAFVLGRPENNPLFQHSACHNHYHLQDIMLYELLDATTQQPVRVNGVAVVGRKQGFCMEDIAQVAGPASSPVYDCSYQGVSPGWADIYDSSLDCQWVDVTGVPAGDYVLRITVNPLGRYHETNRSNDSATARVTID
jgi:hypothetical protein